MLVCVSSPTVSSIIVYVGIMGAIPGKRSTPPSCHRQVVDAKLHAEAPIQGLPCQDGPDAPASTRPCREAHGSSFQPLFLVAFWFLVVRPGAPSSVLAPSN